MPVLHVPEHLQQRQTTKTLATLVRFGGVGIAATITYFVLANIFVSTVLTDAKQASLAAYTSASIISYLGHRTLTFQSDQLHRVGLPRFVISTILGCLLSYLLPKLLDEQLSLSAQVAFGVICFVVPVVNYVLFRFWVFALKDSESASLK
jgi:putative flippase GtrA